ncbi:MAG: hypothetical protein P9X24_10685 [Candidatus Hatepunaea meridiana]|nr:hypothetical protein [Candidatus Hatepunaea meridiana]
MRDYFIPTLSKDMSWRSIHAIVFQVFSLLIFLSVLIGCNGDTGPSEPEATAQDKVDQGWELFEDADYIPALAAFQSAIDMDATLADAFNGAGWSAGKIPGCLEDAANFFERSQIDNEIPIDALGGWLFVNYQLGEWENVILQAETLMQDQSGWRFYHEQTVDFLDVRLVVAMSYFNLGNFDLSLEIIVLYLNESFEVDVSTQAGRRELNEEIERLRGIYG